MNYLIKHSDLVNLGYIFFDKNDEETYLNKLNEEFAFSVGRELSEKLCINKLIELTELKPENICSFFEKNIPESKNIIKKIRKEFLERIKEDRKRILLSGIQH